MLHNFLTTIVLQLGSFLSTCSGKQVMCFNHLFARTDAFKHSLFHRFTRTWSSLPEHVRNEFLFDFNNFKVKSW